MQQTAHDNNETYLLLTFCYLHFKKLKFITGAFGKLHKHLYTTATLAQGMKTVLSFSVCYSHLHISGPCYAHQAKGHQHPKHTYTRWQHKFTPTVLRQQTLTFRCDIYSLHYNKWTTLCFSNTLLHKLLGTY